MSLKSFWQKNASLFWPFGLAMEKTTKLRATLYARGILPSYQASSPVISVGNITLGGEGKTPLVIWLTNFLQEKGFAPAVITRGYGGKEKGPVLGARDGIPLRTPYEIGDEAYLLGIKTKAPIIIARDRAKGAAFATEKLKANVLVLDDGFQHLKLKRDLDIVLFSAGKDPFCEKVFPAGYLREPLAALCRAHVFLITKADRNAPEALYLSERLASYQKPVFFAPFVTESPYPLENLWQEKNEESFPAREKFVAFCGLANPEPFFQEAQRRAKIVATLSFEDHASYGPKEIKKLLLLREKKEAFGFLTTEKDAVKLKDFVKSLSPCYVLPVKAAPEENFEAFILKYLRNAASL
ncbi:tetraacyldisaccharide 4'-kinase [Thermodesulfatator atlanticus]|uniref:tetraacyldisaccharide 4'-kinase n=1 Tax=Thermodesulfatator atlanticus TaxID=501497 RepID=UPI0003B34098|nr:tetraacyldisaccharide 4'-kinase [Thermodesulfatator atlanticus]